jgi:hypothetical protein
VDKPGLLYDKRCGTYLVDLVNADAGMPTSWARYVRGYMKRHKSAGGRPMAPIGGGCPAPPTAKPKPSDEPVEPDTSPEPEPAGRGNNGNGNGNGNGKPDKPKP